MRRPEPRTLLIAGGAFALALPLALILLPGDTPDRAAAAPVLPPSPPAIAEPAAPPPPPPPSAAGLKLHGLLGRGAIIALADGRQRFFAIGREVAPGLSVARIEPHAVILASDGGELRLGFDGAAANPEGAPGQAPAAATAEDRLRDETLSYRLGLAARQASGRTAGFVVRPGVSMPALERAGLRPGDLILSVNGSRFDEERMLELAWEMANASRTEFEIERGGRRMRLAGR
jgi:type II secretory pathway component PulC